MNKTTGYFHRYPFEGCSAKGYQHRSEKIMLRVMELSLISEHANDITRTFGSGAFIAGCNKVQSWMNLAGLETRIDNIGNVRGRFNCGLPAAKTLVIASHIDTVVNAGKFDGPLGVIMGLDALENIIENKISIPFNIELIAFSDEEGVRFQSTYLGSKVVAGNFNMELLDMKDENGESLQQVMEAMKGHSEKLEEDAIKKEDWLGYYEVHIEQGPVLYDRNMPVAIVTHVAGQQRAEIIFKGVAGHAGTVPMDMRNDALCAAAEFIIEMERYAVERTSEVVATVGKLSIPSAASNVIPGTVVISVDLRSASENILKQVVQSVKEICSDVCNKRRIDFEWKHIQAMRPVACDKRLVMLLEKAVVDSECEVVELVSGAGHDAVPVSEVAPVCMLFVRCYKGISHNPLENVEGSDVATAARVTDNFIRQLALAM